jgi:hypothetical protein
VATAVATAGIVVTLALQAFGKPAPPGNCDARPCPASTTAAVAAVGDDSVGTPAQHRPPANHQHDRARPGGGADRRPDLGGRRTADDPPGVHGSADHRPAAHHDQGPDHHGPTDHRRDHDHDSRHGNDLAGRAGQRFVKNWWRLATAVSELSLNRPSTPRRKKSRYSAGASPVARR